MQRQVLGHKMKKKIDRTAIIVTPVKVQKHK